MLEGTMSAVLEVENLTKRYGEIVVSDALSFSVATGTCLGVIGPNGAGKTSVFNLIDGGVRADAGTVRLAGQNVTALPRHRRARLGIARAYQIPQPFPDLTVFENLLVASTYSAGLRGGEASRAAMEVLDRVGLGPLRNTVAGSLTLLNRKRLELAKALAARPRLLLLDEIAGGLTEAEVHVLVDFVRSIKPEFAIIWIEHIAHALARTADVLMVLHFGRKIVEGEPAATLASAQVKEIYLGIPVDAAA
jgi:branched-chain amino acid transport system ATP-binding protein